MRVRVLEEGQTLDVTEAVGLRLAAANTQEVQGSIQPIAVELMEFKKYWKLGVAKFEGKKKSKKKLHRRV
jgi:hypothetical protein